MCHVTLPHHVDIAFSSPHPSHLEQSDEEMHCKAKAIIKMCYGQKKVGNPMFASLPTTMESLLRVAVGESHWNEASSKCNQGKFSSQTNRSPHRHGSGTFLGEDNQARNSDLASELRGKTAFLHFVTMMDHEKA